MRGPEIAALGRLARRTARRNWKRTALIVALIAIPVAGAQIAAGMIAAGKVTQEEYAAQALGAADVDVSAYGSSPEVQVWVDEEIANLAPDADVLAYRTVHGAVSGIASFVEMTDLEIADPLAAGMLGLVDGRLPSGTGEVAVSNALLTLVERKLGDEIELVITEGARDVGTFTVVGVVRDALYKNRSVAILFEGDMDAVFAWDVDAEFAVDGYAHFYREAHWLVGGVEDWEFAVELDGRWERAKVEFIPEPAVSPRPETLATLPAELYSALTVDQVAELEEYALTHESWQVEEEAWRTVPFVEFASVGSTPRRGFAEWETGIGEVLQAPSVLGTLGAALLLAEVALVAGAAYATGIRRRLRELGLMSVNGATDQHLRWAVVGEGIVAGLLGAGIGTAIAVTAMIFGRPLMQRFIDRLIDGLPIGPLELLGPAIVGIAAATIAAWVPARTAARVPATTALQGRMPLQAPRRWLVPFGLGLSGFGAFLLVVAKTAGGESGVWQAGLGVVLMIGGFALLSGPLVSWVGDRADRLPATLRLVVRDSARQRTRAATAMAATMVVLLAPVLMGIGMRTDAARQGIYGLPEDGRQVLIGGYGWQDGTSDVGAEDVAAIAEILPNAVQAPLHIYDGWARLAAIEVGRDAYAEYGYVPFPDESHPAAVGLAAADRDLISALGLGLTDLEVADAGAILLGVQARTVDVVVGDTTIEAREVPAHVLRWSLPRLLVTPQVAEDLGLVTTTDAVLMVNDRPIPYKQELELAQLNVALQVSIEPGLTPLQIELIGMGASLVVVLLIIALVTALSATESDHDLRTMVAVGAPPRIRRRFLGAQTWYYTLFAAALATPLALLLFKVSVNDWGTEIGPFGTRASDAMVVPWLEIGIVVIAIPLLVGLITALVVRSAATVPPRRAG